MLFDILEVGVGIVSGVLASGLARDVLRPAVRPLIRELCDQIKLDNEPWSKECFTDHDTDRPVWTYENAAETIRVFRYRTRSQRFYWMSLPEKLNLNRAEHAALVEAFAEHARTLLITEAAERPAQLEQERQRKAAREAQEHAEGSCVWRRPTRARRKSRHSRRRRPSNSRRRRPSSPRPRARAWKQP